MKRLSLFGCVAVLAVMSYAGRANAQIVIDGKCGRLIIGGPVGISESADTGWGNYPGTHGFVPGYGNYPDYSYNWPTLREAIENNPRRQKVALGVEAVPVEALPSSCAVVQVLVPADAELRFSGNKTEQGGMIRRFATPALTPGKSYTYEVQAVWHDNGREVARTQTVTVRPEQRLTVDFLSPELQSTPLASRAK